MRRRRRSFAGGHTLNAGFTARLPERVGFASNVYYGSGFVNGLAGAGQGPYNGSYLPAHTTFDVSANRALGDRCVSEVRQGSVRR